MQVIPGTFAAYGATGEQGDNRPASQHRTQRWPMPRATQQHGQRARARPPTPPGAMISEPVTCTATAAASPTIRRAGTGVRAAHALRSSSSTSARPPRDHQRLPASAQSETAGRSGEREPALLLRDDHDDTRHPAPIPVDARAQRRHRPRERADGAEDAGWYDSPPLRGGHGARARRRSAYGPKTLGARVVVVQARRDQATTPRR